MKSKWLILIMVLGLVIAACGGSDTAEETTEVAEEPAESLDSPATTAAPTTTAGPTASVGMVYDIGGRGLSGSGYKAGGPNYLIQFLNEKVVSKNSVAFSGNAELLNIQED